MLITLLSVLLLVQSVQENEVHEWLTPLEHDFGKLKQGIPERTIYRFKNNSEFPVFIDNVRTTCGCTAPDWSPDAVAPDSIGTITIEYDAKKEGYFRKRILVFFNHQRKPDKLYIEGEVK